MSNIKVNAMSITYFRKSAALLVMTASLVGGASASDSSQAEAFVPMCEETSDLPADFALAEEAFTLENALSAQETLETTVGETLNEIILASQEAPDTTAEKVKSSWETLALARGNSLLSIRGYLLKQKALAAPEQEREEAVADFCKFVVSNAAYD